MNLRSLKIVPLYGCFIFLPLLGMENVNYLQKIPHDILLHIISFLKFTDLNAVASTNNYLNTFMKIKGFNSFIEHNKDSYMILYRAAEHGDCKRIKAMFDYTSDKTPPSKIQINSLGLKKYSWQENHHNCALLFAINYQQYAAALLLMEQNVDLFIVKSFDLLFKAIRIVKVDKENHSYDRDYVQNLLNNGPNTLPVNSIVEKLIKKGATINREHIREAFKISSDNFILRKIKEKIGLEEFIKLAYGQSY